MDDAPIFINALSCETDDTDVYRDCEVSALGLSQCDHSRDIGVKCEGMYVCA